MFSASQHTHADHDDDGDDSAPFWTCDGACDDDDEEDEEKSWRRSLHVV